MNGRISGATHTPRCSGAPEQSRGGDARMPERRTGPSGEGLRLDQDVPRPSVVPALRALTNLSEPGKHDIICCPVLTTGAVWLRPANALNVGLDSV